MKHDPDIVDVIRSIAEGSPVDWDTRGTTSADASTQSVLDELKVISRIAEVHGLSRSDAAALDETAEGRLRSWGSLTVLERIGSGAYGEVYRAWDPRLDRDVALKLLRQSAAPADSDLPTIEEGRLLARLRHPNIVTIHGADRIDGRVGIWMELVDGKTLDGILRQSGPMSAKDVGAIGIEVCRGVAAIHQAGLVHRDIKAQNVMRQDDGRIVLMDFGTGRASNATHARSITGTPLYLAPEVLGGEAATPLSDLYSVGVLLYHLSTGSFPVVGETLDGVRHAHAAGRTAATRRDHPSVPRGLAAIIDRALEPSPSARFHNAAAMEAALRAYQSAPRRYGLLAASLAIVATTALAVWTVERSVTRNRRGGDPKVAGMVQQERPSQTRDPSEAKGSSDPRASALHFQGRDWVLLAAFENRTGETVLEGTLEFALERELSNSPFVNVVPRERIEDTLQLMRQPTSNKVDSKLGREVCLRDGGIRALLTGRVEKIGTAYVLTSQIVNPMDGVAMVSLTEDADSEAGLLPAVRRLAFRVREVLGEMVATIHTDRAALEKVTTPSLRALYLYSQASALMSTDDKPWQEEPAERFLRQAIAEDPEFASAHILLAHAIHNQERPKEEFLPYATRAAALAERVSDSERYFILGSYHGLLADTALPPSQVRLERRRAVAEYQALLRLKPDHYWGVGNLAFELDALRPDPSMPDPETAEAFARLADVRPGNVGLNQSALERCYRVGDVTRARRIAERLRAASSLSVPGDHRFAIWSLREASREGDVHRMRQVADEWFRLLPEIKLKEPQAEPAVALDLVGLYLDVGRFGDARSVARRVPAGHPFGVIDWALQVVDSPGGSDSLREFVTANSESVKHLSGGAVGIFAHYLYQLHMLNELRELAASRRNHNTRNTAAVAFEIDGHLAMAEGQVEKAVRYFESARDTRRQDDWARRRIALEVADAWRARGELKRAAAVLERDQIYWPVDRNQGQGAVFYSVVARDRLASLYHSLGRTSEAEKIDEELLKLLAVADPNHPILMRLMARQSGARVSR